jgi:four helix bundle protein
MSTNKTDFIDAFRQRTKLFALNTIFIYRLLPKTDEARIIGKQLLRSSTSTAANYRAACRARSKAEFYSKLSISIEESDETQFWLELLIDAEIGPVGKLKKLYNEATEITAVLTSARKTADRK